MPRVLALPPQQEAHVLETNFQQQGFPRPIRKRQPSLAAHAEDPRGPPHELVREQKNRPLQEQASLPGSGGSSGCDCDVEVVQVPEVCLAEGKIIPLRAACKSCRPTSVLLLGLKRRSRCCTVMRARERRCRSQGILVLSPGTRAVTTTKLVSRRRRNSRCDSSVGHSVHADAGPTG